MMKSFELDPITLTLITSGLMVFVMVIIMAAVSLLRGSRISTEGEEMYIGGESEEVLKYRIPSVIALYWGIVKRAWRRAFDHLRDTIHTGILNDWYGFMSVWLGFLLLIALIVVLLYLSL